MDLINNTVIFVKRAVELENCFEHSGLGRKFDKPIDEDVDNLGKRKNFDNLRRNFRF